MIYYDFDAWQVRTENKCDHPISPYEARWILARLAQRTNIEPNPDAVTAIQTATTLMGLSKVGEEVALALIRRLLPSAQEDPNLMAAALLKMYSGASPDLLAIVLGVDAVDVESCASVIANSVVQVLVQE